MFLQIKENLSNLQNMNLQNTFVHMLYSGQGHYQKGGDSAGFLS